MTNKKSIFAIEDHDFSVYEGLSQTEIVNELNRLRLVDIIASKEIANVLIDIGLLKSWPFLKGYGGNLLRHMDLGIVYSPYVPLSLDTLIS